jgi:antagonist of KipI
MIRVEAPGMFTTVQDLGRDGFGPIGVSAAGASDSVALRVGNRLVGNKEGAAGLEMTLLGGRFAFDSRAVVALTGSDFGAMVDGVPVEMWSAFEVKAGQTLKLGASRGGARCYLCVDGGIEVSPFLGSASTHVLSGLGGFEGRALQKGDGLQIGSSGAAESFVPTRVARELIDRFSPRKTLRVTRGPQSEWFSEAARRTFYESSYKVSEASNRMGLRLDSPAISSEGACGEMVTEGASLGAIQVPESGLPIILFVDQQTTGGYPKIANVIAADMGSVGQLRPRDEVRFEEVAMQEALALLIDQEKFLRSETWMAR